MCTVGRRQAAMAKTALTGHRLTRRSDTVSWPGPPRSTLFHVPPASAKLDVGAQQFAGRTGHDETSTDDFQPRSASGGCRRHSRSGVREETGLRYTASAHRRRRQGTDNLPRRYLSLLHMLLHQLPGMLHANQGLCGRRRLRYTVPAVDQAARKTSALTNRALRHAERAWFGLGSSGSTNGAGKR